jgi:HK97 family phage prohead protease
MTAAPERRFLAAESPTASGRTISGWASRFNSRSENLGSKERPVFEIITPGAFDDVLKDDVIAAWNHDESRILARSNNGVGSLKLSVDENGLHYSFTAPDTTTGNDVLESIKRGDVNASSFAFVVASGGDSYTIEPDGSRLRTITKIGKLYDISPVTRPAYSATTVSARSLSGESVFPCLNNWTRLFDLLK